MVIRHRKMSKKTLDVDDTPIEANISVPSKRKYRNIQSHQHENSRAGNLKEKQQRFTADLFDKPADADDDYVQYLTGAMMSIWTDNNCEGVNDNAEDNDPQYEIFWDSLKQDGNSYVLEVSEKNGLSEPLKYDAKDKFDDELDQDTQSQKDNTIGGNVGDDRSNSSRGSKLEDPKAFGSLPENQRKESMVQKVTRSDPINPNPFGDHQFLVEELIVEGTYVSGSQWKIGTQDGYGEKHKSESLRNERWKSDAAANIEKKKDDDFDEEYQVYCNNLSCDGNNLVFKYKDAPAIVYEGDSRIDNITYSMKRDPKFLLPIQTGRSDAIVEEDDSCQYLGSLIRERHSLFREQVMRILRKPYDKKEHQMLSENILARKPIERNIDLRFGREQLYTVNKEGKSYLDHYYDLRRKLEAAKTSHKELILLRGFFFWLQLKPIRGFPHVKLSTLAFKLYCISSIKSSFLWWCFLSESIRKIICWVSSAP